LNLSSCAESALSVETFYEAVLAFGTDADIIHVINNCGECTYIHNAAIKALFRRATDEETHRVAYEHVLELIEEENESLFPLCHAFNFFDQYETHIHRFHTRLYADDTVRHLPPVTKLPSHNAQLYIANLFKHVNYTPESIAAQTGIITEPLSRHNHEYAHINRMIGTFRNVAQIITFAETVGPIGQNFLVNLLWNTFKWRTQLYVTSGFKMDAHILRNCMCTYIS
jgi:hypothetical protein